MDFIIVGGGWYGSFYTRQLLRATSKIKFEKLHIVDHNPDCQVVQEFGYSQERIVYHFQDWKEYFSNYFEDLLSKHRRGEKSDDHYVPPCIAPHIIFDLFLEKAKKRHPSLTFFPKPFEPTLGTPLDMKLPTGHRALSFATWTCPYSCIEPPTCPRTQGPKDLDMKSYLTKFFQNTGTQFQPDSIHLFQCRHLAMGVATIPMREILHEYLAFEKIVSQAGRHLSTMATLSSCHGLIGLVESSHV